MGYRLVTPLFVKLGAPASIGAAFIFSACGALSPAAPSSGSGRFVTIEGQAVNAVDGQPRPGVTVTVGAGPAVTTDPSGGFRMEVPDGAPSLVATGDGIVERRTHVRVPSSSPLRLSLIPAGFELGAFDELCRSSGQLQRWTTVPGLVVQAALLDFTDTSAEEFVALREQLSDGEAASIVDDLVRALGQLTGGAFTAFSSVRTETAPEGARVAFSRTGTIVVARFRGLKVSGYGRWAAKLDGTVVGGAVYLDSEVEKTSGLRRAIRTHELGHALGYTHVNARRSVMNATVVTEANEFDLAAGAVAFQRPPGNRSPDIDPDGTTLSVVADGSTRWSVPIR